MPPTDSVARALRIVGDGDRMAALVLLDEIASAGPGSAAPDLPGPLADAVLAVALGELSEDYRQAVADYERSRSTLTAIVEAIGTLPLTAQDLLVIRAALDERLDRMQDGEGVGAWRASPHRAADHEVSPTDGVDRVQLGPGRYLELKFIPDRRSGKRYGPYMYLRWVADGRFRSRYIGKPPR